MREIARVQQGFFATQDRIVQIVSKLFRFPAARPGAFVVLDAGCGTGIPSLVFPRVPILKFITALSTPGRCWPLRGKKLRLPFLFEPCSVPMQPLDSSDSCRLQRLDHRVERRLGPIVAVEEQRMVRAVFDRKII